MRILQVYPYFYPAWVYGGVTRVVYDMSKHLADRGHEVTVYTTDALDEKSRIKISSHLHYINGVRTYYFKNLSNYLAYKHNLALPVEVFFRTKKEIKEFNVIHLHGARTFLNVIVYHYAKKYGIPYVAQAHGALPRLIKKQRLKNIFDLFFGCGILKGASKVIAVSKAEVEQYKQIGINEDKIVIVPNGIDIEAFKDLPLYGKFREKYDIKEGHLILFLGRINERKGIDFLIKSFSKLIREMSDVVLAIVGPDDGYKRDVEKLIMTLKLGNRIKLIGYIDEKYKLSAYVDADVLVYPAIFEIFGLVPFEAIMCGTPVIVTDDCGCGELVEEGGAGCLVKYGDVEGLKEKMKWVIENPEEGGKKMKRGKKYINENLLWGKIVEELENVYGGLI